MSECRICALASAVSWPGVPVSADSQDVIRRDRWQIVHSSHRGSRDIEHLGSAHTAAEVELLKAAARQKLAAGQGELDLGLETGTPGGPLPIISSRMGCLVDALSHAYDVLGFTAATGGDEAFFQLVAARIIEPVSKLDSLRVLEEAGLAPVPYQTVTRRLRVFAREAWRQQISAAYAAHARALAEKLIDLGPGRACRSEWLAMNPRLAWLYKCRLTEELARRNKLVPTTDQMPAHAVMDSPVDIRFMMGQAGRPLKSADFQAGFGLLSINAVIPRDLDQVPPSKIVEIRRRFGAQFDRWREYSDEVPRSWGLSCKRSNRLSFCRHTWTTP